MAKAYVALTLSTSFPNAFDFRLLQNSEHGRSMAEIGEAMLRGKAVDLKDLPMRLELNECPLPQPLPRIFTKDGFLIVAPDVAEVISKFDLGSGHIWPLEYLGSGECAYFAVYIGGGKSSWLQEKSTAKMPSHRGKFRIDSISLKRGLGTVVLSPEALEGADLWVEPPHSTELAFFSEGLAEALMDLHLADGFPLWECKIDD